MNIYFLCLVATKKRGLCSFDDKRFLLDDNVHTMAFGHYSLPVVVIEDPDPQPRAHDKELVVGTPQLFQRWNWPPSRRNAPPAGQVNHSQMQLLTAQKPADEQRAAANPILYLEAALEAYEEEEENLAGDFYAWDILSQLDSEE